MEDESLFADTNLFYGEDVVNNSYDVYCPKSINGKIPTVIMIHGGGYIVGEKEGIRNFCCLLAKKGFLVFNIEYTKCDCEEKKYFPYQVEEFFKFYKHVSEESRYSNLIDYKNVFVAGDSAGAHIASLVGAIQTNPELKMEYGLPGGPMVKGLILMSPSFGIYNFAGLFPKKIYHEIIFGKKDVRSNTSLLTHNLKVTTEDFPPTLMFSVKHDPVVGIHKKKFLKLAEEMNLSVHHFEYQSGYKLFHSCMMNYPEQYPTCFEKIQEFIIDAQNNSFVCGVQKEDLYEINHQDIFKITEHEAEEFEEQTLSDAIIGNKIF